MEITAKPVTSASLALVRVPG